MAEEEGGGGSCIMHVGFCSLCIEEFECHGATVNGRNGNGGGNGNGNGKGSSSEQATLLAS